MYTLLVCGDMYGEKANLEITFPNMPTIGDIQRKVTEIFTAEAALKRPSGFPAVDFCVSKIQIYDDVMLRWTDLMTCSQLHEYDQLYVFQPQSPWHIDVQKDLPPPRPPTIVQQNHSANYSVNRSQQQQNTSTYSQQNQSGFSASPSQQSPYGRPASNNSGGSPTQHRLEEQRRREEQMRQELNRMREETERLEREAAHELEEERRRQREEHERMVRQMSDDIRQQREALNRSEEEMKRLQNSL